MDRFKNLIGGAWVAASDGAAFEVRNPARPDEVVGLFPSATAGDTEQAIETARAALPGWAMPPPPQRGAILDKASRLLETRLEEMSIALTREEGKTLAESRAEVARARDLFRYYAGEGWRMAGTTLPSNSDGELLYTRREPVGVVGIITPWNFPIAIPAWKIAPALVYGNTVVFKPAGQTPYVATLLAQALVEAGLPAGAFNLVIGGGKVVGDTLTGSAQINAVSFTGSYAVGTRVYSRAMAHMARVQLEMGGKNPLVVLADADLELAVDLAVRGGFGGTGQACTATSRVIVDESVADRFAQGLVGRAGALIVGDGLDPKTQMGPAVGRDQLGTDLKYIEIGRQEGARLLAGGGPVGQAGFYVQPTVFDGVTPDMRIAQAEIFGPVIGIIRAAGFDDAVDKANAIGFGLSAAVVTRDLRSAFQFANRIEAGIVRINEPTVGPAIQAPFGGFKQSSANTFKEQGQAAIEFYTRTKTVYVGHG